MKPLVKHIFVIPDKPCPPVELEHGRVSVNRNQFGATAFYECDDEHPLISGDPIRECLSNNKWSGDQPVCSSVYIRIKLSVFTYKI